MLAVATNTSVPELRVKRGGEKNCKTDVGVVHCGLVALVLSEDLRLHFLIERRRVF